MADNEFKVNEHITLKLLRGSTVIYVKGKRFDLCKYLLLEVPIKEITSLDDIESIDEAAEGLDRSMERTRSQSKISPKTEFWGHCSNIQTWAENNYNTRLLHSNIAFPLLKRLTEAGDPIANKVFKEEIGKRFTRGYSPVVNYLLEERYLDYLDEEERGLLFEQIDLNSLLNLDYRELFPLLKKLCRAGISRAKKVLKVEIAKRIMSGYYPVIQYLTNLGFLKYLSKEERGFLFEQIDLNSLLNLDDTKLFPFLKKLCRAGISIAKKIFKDEITKRFVSGSFLDIEYLLKKNYLTYFNETEIETLFSNIDISSILKLDLSKEGFQVLPKYITKLTSLQELNLSSNRLKTLPEPITKLTSLIYLDLNGNELKTLPESIGNLTSLQTLHLEGIDEVLIGYISNGNELKTLPESIVKLTSLQELNLYGNKLKTLPEPITKLTSLQKLNLNYNKLSTLPESIGSLTSLQKLDLSYNKLSTLPESIIKLESLEVLSLGRNKFTTIPEPITKLTSLQELRLYGNKLGSRSKSILKQLKKNGVNIRIRN